MRTFADSEWPLLKQGANCKVKKENWNYINPHPLRDCISYCISNKATIAMYRNLNSNCACCNDPPGVVEDDDRINMYQMGKLF